ncbi:MAG: LysR substrate-binding domain-containing protein [Pseudomonadota bacterium]
MRNWLPSLNALRAFESVARHLNYHSAARELSVTPAAVKQLVSKLEETIGAKLLERKGQGLILTARGSASREDLTAAMQKMMASVEKMRDPERAKQLILTVEASFATAWLVPRLDAFRRRYPKINVLIDSSQHIVDLHRGDADIAIRYGVESAKDLFVHRLFDDQIFPACSPTLVNGPPTLAKLEDLNSVPLIHWDMSQLEWAHATKRWFAWEQWLKHVGADHVSCDGGLYFNDYGLAVQSAIAGQGMILASWPILREPIASGLMVCPFPEKVTTDIGYDLVTTYAAQKRPEVIAFCDWIKETAYGE